MDWLRNIFTTLKVGLGMTDPYMSTMLPSAPPPPPAQPQTRYFGLGGYVVKYSFDPKKYMDGDTITIPLDGKNDKLASYLQSVIERKLNGMLYSCAYKDTDKSLVMQFKTPGLRSDQNLPMLDSSTMQAVLYALEQEIPNNQQALKELQNYASKAATPNEKPQAAQVAQKEVSPVIAAVEGALARHGIEVTPALKQDLSDGIQNAMARKR